MRESDSRLISKPLSTIIIVIVTIVWAANFALQFFVADYKSDVSINGIFMAIVGGALALSRRSLSNGSKSDTEDDEDGDSNNSIPKVGV